MLSFKPSIVSVGVTLIFDGNPQIIAQRWPNDISSVPDNATVTRLGASAFQCMRAGLHTLLDQNEHNQKR